MNTNRRIVMFSASALSPAALGPYGSSLLSTSCFNQLASHGLVCDRFIADSSASSLVLESMWTGQHAGQQRTSTSHLFRQLNAAEVRSAFISDAPDLALAAADFGFSSVQILGDLTTEIASEIEVTRMARLIALGIQQLYESPETSLLWLHLDSLACCWDAPLEYRGSWAEEGDEEGPQLRYDVVPPALHNDSFDPDDLLSWNYTYADQIGLLDSVLQPLRALIAEDAGTVLSIVGTSGVSLGSHQWLGPNVGPLLSPRTHLPLLIHSAAMHCVRSDTICQPPSIAETIGRYLLEKRWESGGASDLLQQANPEHWGVDSLSDQIAVSIGDGELALQTADWHWYRDTKGIEHLYRKPDDRWDLNNIIDRAVDVATFFRSKADV